MKTIKINTLIICILAIMGLVVACKRDVKKTTKTLPDVQIDHGNPPRIKTIPAQMATWILNINQINKDKDIEGIPDYRYIAVKCPNRTLDHFIPLLGKIDDEDEIITPTIVTDPQETKQWYEKGRWSDEGLLTIEDQKTKQAKFYMVECQATPYN